MKPFQLDTNPKIKPGFKEPDGYFESFESKLFEKLEKDIEPKVISIYSSKTKWYWIAAAVLIFSISLPIYNHFIDSTLALPTSDEIEYYVNAHPSITSEAIISELSLDDIQAMQVQTDLKSENIENYLIQTESIEYYLID